MKLLPLNIKTLALANGECQAGGKIMEASINGPAAEAPDQTVDVRVRALQATAAFLEQEIVEGPRRGMPEVQLAIHRNQLESHLASLASLGVTQTQEAAVISIDAYRETA